MKKRLIYFVLEFPIQSETFIEREIRTNLIYIKT